MNHAALGQLPAHITHVRQGSVIWERFAPASWNSRDFKTVSNAKKEVRLSIGCKGGPRSNVRTAESLEL